MRMRTVDPIKTFAEWYTEAQKDAMVHPDTVALATAAANGRPSVRMVYYRGIRDGGFSFFTNYESRKGRELAGNPFAAMVFYWPHLGRQVRIEGSVQRLSAEESDAYFYSRPYQSQITASISAQSRSMESENDFADRLAKAEQSMLPIARPESWGGFKLVPEAIEFWTRGEFRRHHRVVYRMSRDGWTATRLYP